MLNLAARIRHGLLNPAHTADMMLAGVAIAAGVWLLVPGWAVMRYRHIAAQMTIVCPIWYWGLIFTSKGTAALIGVVAHRPSIVVASHLVGVGVWLFLGGIMSFRNAPPMEGFFCAVIGFFCLIRLAQIPSD